MRKSYKELKEKTRQKAIEWQQKLLSNYNYNYEAYKSALFWGNYFEKQAKRYGLVKEFRENGII